MVGATQFAQIPLLNESQLVARWKLETPPAVVSETQQLPIDGLGAGIYLIEATDGTYKAYTVAIVTSIAVVERGQQRRGESLLLPIARRARLWPMPDVALWAGGKHAVDRNNRCAMGWRICRCQVRGGAQGQRAGERVDPGAAWGRCGAGDAVGLQLRAGNAFECECVYIYTDRPVYRPGHTVHIKGYLRRRRTTMCFCRRTKSVTLEVTGPDDKAIFKQDMPVSAHGTVAADLTLPSDAALGYYYIRFNGQLHGSGSFYVEEYKKPEYQVTVKAGGAAGAARQSDAGHDRGALLLWRAGGRGQGDVRGAHNAALLVGSGRSRRQRRQRRARMKRASEEEYDMGRDRAAGTRGRAGCEWPARCHAFPWPSMASTRPGLPHRGAGHGCGQSRSQPDMRTVLAHLWIVPRERGADQLCGRAAASRCA